MRVLLFLWVAVLGTAELMACTGILMEAKDGSTINGRTVEFGIPLEMGIAVVPRKAAFVGKTPLGKGLAYAAKYAVTGVYCFDDPVVMDGVNEKGLVAAAFYFSNYASYAEVTKQNQSKALSPIDFPNWILTQFATIDEVKKALSSVLIAPTILKDWGDTPPPMHYIVYEPSGKSIVIEPLDGKLVVYENEIGVITNSPTFDWQLTNLSNYINLTPENAPPHKLRGFNLTTFGQGSGMLGLPGDFTPPSRFVRAAFFSTTSLPAKDASEAVDETFHVLNQFDIPLGAVRAGEGKQTSYDFTQLTTVKDPKNLHYFFRSYENQAIEYVSLSQFDYDATAIKKMKVQGKQKREDVSSMLK